MFVMLTYPLHRIDNLIEVNHHDLGFLYTPSCVSAYKLTGNLEARDAAIKAAKQLASRYQKTGIFSKQSTIKR